MQSKSRQNESSGGFFVYSPCKLALIVNDNRAHSINRLGA